MCTDSEGLHVTKLVDFIPRIQEHLDLYFFYFSTILYVFYKFTDLTQGVFLHFCAKALKRIESFTDMPLEAGCGVGRPESGETRRRR